MSIETYPPPPNPYTRKLLEQIISLNLTNDLAYHTCYKLSAINAYKRQEFINVILQFDILSQVQKTVDEVPWIYCIEQASRQPKADDLTDNDEERKQKVPSTAIIICCCIIGALVLMVLVLRCRSCILRRCSDSQRKNAQKFWYCNEAGRNLDRKHPDSDRMRANGKHWVPINQSAQIFPWSDSTPLKNSNERDIRDSQVKHWNRSQAFRQAQAHADSVQKQKHQRLQMLGDRPSSLSPCSSLERPADFEAIRAHLAAGYSEYYKRQGKVLSEITNMNHNCPSSSKRNPTLREIYQLSGSSTRSPNLDTMCKRDSMQSVQATLSQNQLSKSKLDSFNTSNHSISSQSILLAGKRSQILSLDSERASVPDDSAFINNGSRPVFSCESNSDLQSSESSRMKDSTLETYSDTRKGVCNTSVSSNASTESNRAVLTLNIPAASVSTSAEQTMVFHNDKTFGSYQSFQVVRRPTLCLFSARKRPHPKVHSRRSGQNMHLGLGPYQESPKSAATLTPVRSNQHSPTHATGLGPHSRSAEAKSWSNLKDSDQGPFPYSASYLSAGSTLSPPHPGIDLPDVYLYPPSMSSLQSNQGSMLIPPYSENQCRTEGQFPVSKSCVSIRNSEFVSNGHEQNVLRAAHSNDIDDKRDTKIWAAAASLATEEHQTSELSHSQKQSNEIKEFNHRDSNTSRNSSVDFSSPSLRNGKRRRVSPRDLEPPPGLHRSKRALSLILRPKSPKSLGEELQSIFDRHYEMTGIRMLAVSPTNPPRSRLDSNQGIFDWTNRNKIEKLRRSYSFGIDDVNLRLSSGMKAAISALHLDCFRSDEMLPKKNQPSAVSSLATKTLSCMAPVHSPISLATGVPKKTNGSITPMRRSRSLFPTAYTTHVEDKKTTKVMSTGMQKARLRNVKSSANILEVK